MAARPEHPEDFVVRVTARIAEARRQLGITQDELAEGLGTATRNVQRMEAGQNLTLHTLARVAAVLGVPPEVLVESVALKVPARRYPLAPAHRDHAVAERRPPRPGPKKET